MCQFFIFIIIFYVFVISFSISINSVTYSFSNTFLYPITTYRYQLKDLILLWSFFKAACHGNPGAEENFGGSSLYISRDIFRKSSVTSANNNELL